MNPSLQPREASPQTSSGFDRVARIYRWAEYLLLGPLLAQTRKQWLGHVTDANQALVLGDGDGRFLARLLGAAPHLRAVAVDNSERMLQLLAARCAFAGTRLQAYRATAPNLPPELDLSRTDLIVTHFFLDCLSQTQLDHLCAELAQRVAPGCRWLLSDFAVPRNRLWRPLGKAYIRGLYLAFRALTGLQVQQLPDHAMSLSQAGFRRIHHHARLNGLLYSELWQLPA